MRVLHNRLRNLILSTSVMTSSLVQAQTTGGITEVLIQKNIISQREVDSLNTLAVFNDKIKLHNKTFLIGLEFRPRAEYRNGYRQLPNDTTQAAYFGSQRSRLLITYSQPRFKFHTSIQDIRVWGQYGQVSTAGSLNIFEAYMDAGLNDHLSLRIGRQKVELDNGRLFSAANWSQGSRAHDGLNLLFSKEKINSELLLFFNQTSERIFETTFSPSSFSNYKILNVHFLKAKITKQFTLSTINAAGGFQSKAKYRTLYERGTSGGRIEFQQANIYVTLAGYYQYGRLQSGQKIAAYYLQPEIQVKFRKLITRLGAEYMSGDDATHPSVFSKSFVPLYGVAWKFMGNMDYFTSFPSDLKNGGLINPYLFFIYELNKKLSLRSDFHKFYLQNKVYDINIKTINPYLGYENDLSFKYKLNEFSTIDGGFSYMIAEWSMQSLKGGRSYKIPVWGYIMVTIKPELFNHKL